MTTEQAEFEEFGTETSVQRLEREIRERVHLLRFLKGRRKIRVRRKYPPPARRIPGGPDTGRDIVEQLNYVASQLRGACKNPHWGAAHEGVMREAAREIRRLRGVAP